jgi:hypothetical protein
MSTAEEKPELGEEQEHTEDEHTEEEEPSSEGDHQDGSAKKKKKVCCCCLGTATRLLHCRIPGLFSFVVNAAAEEEKEEEGEPRGSGCQQQQRRGAAWARQSRQARGRTQVWHLTGWQDCSQFSGFVYYSFMRISAPGLLYACITRAKAAAFLAAVSALTPLLHLPQPKIKSSLSYPTAFK